MNNKNKLLSTIFLLAILSVIGIASAASTIDSPEASQNMTGTLNLSVTVGPNDEYNMTNVTCFYNSSGGPATTFLVYIANDSHNSLTFENGSIDITGLTETATYNISCDIRNGTGANSYNQTLSFAAADLLTIDSTDPVCSLDGDHKTIPWKGHILLTWTSSDAVSLVSTSTTIDGPQDQATITDTDTNDARTLTSQETKYWGDWLVTVTGTDRPGNTGTCTYEFESYLPDGVDWLEPGESKAPLDAGKTLLILLVVVALAWFVFFRKK